MCSESTMGVEGREEVAAFCHLPSRLMHRPLLEQFIELRLITMA